jgi:hypothetical protein
MLRIKRCRLPAIFNTFLHGASLVRKGGKRGATRIGNSKIAARVALQKAALNAKHEAACRQRLAAAKSAERLALLFRQLGIARGGGHGFIFREMSKSAIEITSRLIMIPISGNEIAATP